MGCDSSVTIGTDYGLHSSGIESWLGGEIYRTLLDRPWGYRASSEMGAGVVAGCKAAEVKERVELYLCSSSGPSWPVIGLTVPLFLTRSTIETKCLQNCG